MASRAWLATWEDTARKRLFAATDTLAHGLGIAPVEQANRVSHLPEPTPRTVGDLEAAAIVAEAVVALRLDVAALRKGVGT